MRCMDKCRIFLPNRARIWRKMSWQGENKRKSGGNSSLWHLWGRKRIENQAVGASSGALREKKCRIPGFRCWRKKKSIADRNRQCFFLVRRGLSEGIFFEVPVVSASAARRAVFGRCGEFNPFQRLGIYQRAGVGAAAGTGAFGDELHADGLHLFLEIEVCRVLHSLRVEHVAEVAQPLDVHALALRHAGVHHAGDVAQHGLHVRVAYGGDFREVSGDGFGFDGFSLYDGLGVMDARPLAECFLPKWHRLVVFLMVCNLLLVRPSTR